MNDTMASLQGRSILITGAATGMGRMYAELAVRDRASDVVLWDIDAAGLERAATAMSGKGSRIHTHVVDVASLESIEEAAELVLGALGAPDVLINNAGIVRGTYFWEHDARRDVAATMDVNALAPMQVTLAFLPAMIAGGRPSRIVNVASAAGLLANPRMSVYAASKWAVIGWSDSLRLELRQAGHDHIKVTTFCPSYISTGMFEGARGPLMTPILEPAKVTERVWRAMKSGQPMLMMPWTVKLSSALRGVLPVAAWDVVAGRVFGVYSSMERFTGRPAPTAAPPATRPE